METGANGVWLYLKQQGNPFSALRLHLHPHSRRYMVLSPLSPLQGVRANHVAAALLLPKQLALWGLLIE